MGYIDRLCRFLSVKPFRQGYGEYPLLEVCFDLVGIDTIGQLKSPLK